MTLLTDSELAAIQGVAQSAMGTAAVIYKRTITQTADGSTNVWTAGATVFGMLYS
jgi:hypothetical protein